MINILLVDDQALIRRGFAMLLSAEPEFTVVGEAADGEAAVAQARALKPDVILMDIRMPGRDGIWATEQIISAGLCARILVLTTFDLDEYAFAALQAGASGFLLKSVRPEEIISAIHSVYLGDAVVSPRITRKLLELHTARPGGSAAGAAGADSAVGAAGQELLVGRGAAAAPLLPDDGAARTDGLAAARQRVAELTSREMEVLLAVAGGLSNAELAKQFFLTEATIKTHVGRILMKLQVRDRVQAVVLAYQLGLVD